MYIVRASTIQLHAGDAIARQRRKSSSQVLAQFGSLKQLPVISTYLPLLFPGEPPVSRSMRSIHKACLPSSREMRQMNTWLRLANQSSSSLVTVLGSKISMWPTLANQNLPWVSLSLPLGSQAMNTFCGTKEETICSGQEQG